MISWASLWIPMFFNYCHSWFMCKAWSVLSVPWNSSLRYGCMRWVSMWTPVMIKHWHAWLICWTSIYITSALEFSVSGMISWTSLWIPCYLTNVMLASCVNPYLHWHQILANCVTDRITKNCKLICFSFCLTSFQAKSLILWSRYLANSFALGCSGYLWVVNPCGCLNWKFFISSELPGYFLFHVCDWRWL